LNDSMSNFAYTDPRSINYVASGKRPRSTIAPTIVFRAGRPIFAIGIPGAARIPTALLQALLDRLAFDRPLSEAIGDTRIHFELNWRKDNQESLPPVRFLAASMRSRSTPPVVTPATPTPAALTPLADIELGPEEFWGRMESNWVSCKIRVSPAA
ncbi:MAG: hypothetical protein EBT98_00005, partial [Opitutaceae bacterium]|nr:hypothetical protein [Opitutaceae bacterium]